MTAATRSETDSFGPIDVAADRLWGAQTQRSIQNFPQHGSNAPWKLRQNYALDLLDLKFSRLDDGALEFYRPQRIQAAA